MHAYEILRLVWWALLGILLIGFAIMDGFDLGTAAVLPFVARNDIERRIAINIDATRAPIDFDPEGNGRYFREIRDMLYGWTNISPNALTLYDHWKRWHISRNEVRDPSRPYQRPALWPPSTCRISPVTKLAVSR